MTQLALDIDVIDHSDCGPGCRLATREPTPKRTDWLMPGTRTWARTGNAGHRCDACGHSCGSTAHHGKCCGESHNHVSPGVCTGHPCRPCQGDMKEAPSRFYYKRSFVQRDGSVWWDAIGWHGHGARMQVWRHQVGGQP